MSAAECDSLGPREIEHRRVMQLNKPMDRYNVTSPERLVKEEQVCGVPPAL